MYILKRAQWSNEAQTRIGDVVPLECVQLPIRLTPRFGCAADPRLTAETSLEYSTEFFLNKYSNKDVFQFLWRR